MKKSGFRVPAACCPFALCKTFMLFVLPLSSCPCEGTRSVWVCGGLGALGGPPGASVSPSSWLLHSRLVPQGSVRLSFRVCSRPLALHLVQPLSARGAQSSHVLPPGGAFCHSGNPRLSESTSPAWLTRLLQRRCVTNK